MTKKAIAAVAIAMLAACGGSSDDDDRSGGGGGGSTRRLTGIEVVPPAATRGVGETQQFAATAVYDNGDRQALNSGVAWTSSAPAVASIDANGLATALNDGETVITGTHQGFSDTARLTVTPPVITSITVTPSPVTKRVGETQQFAAAAQYSDGSAEDPATGIEWSSSAPAVASIDANGLATALAPGGTEIRARRDGVTGAAQLAVEAAPPAPLPFKVGAAERPASFLPFPGFSCLGGYSTFCERRATEEKDPLVAGAVAITGRDDRSFILVKTTNIGYFAAYKAGNGPNGIYDIRQRIARELERRYGTVVVPADHIIVTSDHSHHAPDTIGIWGGESPLYMAILAEASVQAGVAAYENRREARLYAASVQGPPTAGSYDRPPTDDPDREFRVLFAEDRQGARIATLMNYAPHATVLGSSNTRATGDWTAWAAQESALMAGGTGIGLIGALGAMDWNKSGDNDAREAEARRRLRDMLNAAFAARSEVAGNEVAVKTVFIREPLTQPILFANFAPRVPLPVVDSSVSIERAETPPWTTGGAVIGTYAAAVRLGDVFLSAFPGEPFPQLHYALRDCDTLPEGIEAGTDCGSIEGARVNFLLGGANDFLGYMLYTPEQYRQSFEEGALYLAGCPEEALREGAGQDIDGACPDHWALMVSPTIGRHIVCTVQNAARELGFTVVAQNDECPLLTAFDGIAAPAEYPQTDLVPMTPAAFLNSPAAGLVAQCRAQGGPDALCDGLEQVSQAIGGALAQAAGSDPQPPSPVMNPARAGVASKDASWHLGASAGQFSASGAGIARNAGFDPYGHSTRKVGSDILGTRIHTRALVVEGSNGQRVAVVANDLYLPNDLLQRRTAQKLAEHDRRVALGLKDGPVTGITGANLAMTASHSHTSPFYSTPGWGTWIFQDVFDLRFYEYMATQQAEAVIEAAANLKPVRMGGITVHSNDVQAHTYGPKGSRSDTRDGTPAGQPYEYTTQQITIVRFDDISGAVPRPLANWVIFGVHPEWVWGEEIVNGDVTHAVMRMLDRETGALTVMSQRETGASGPHKDTRVHPPQARREFQESGPSGTDRAARILTDTLKRALQRLETNDPEVESRFAPFRSRFDVAHASQRFAPPATRPYPGVSNCNSERVFEGDVGIPILGFPDCFYDHTEFTDALTEPFLAALPYSPTQLRNQLLELGVPIPTSYSATTLTAVEETAAVHLQVFKLGGIVATMSPSEQFTSAALNLETRLDKVPDNLWHGFDWACRLPAGHPVRADEPPAVTRHCTAQNAAYPGGPATIPGSVDDAASMAKVRAQIHNDASGWELDPVYMFNQQDPTPLFTLGSESEPLDPAQIKGNFTHEEFTTHGYELVIAVGMVNDYWGYMPEYRDYRSFDHYRKALNGLGPHGADFLNTRLARMAAQLNGASAPLPVNPLDGVFQAESARAEATAQMLGEAARAYTAIYEATLPADGGTPRIVTEPAPSVPRFSAAILKFVGGSNYSDLPRVVVERCKAGTTCDRQNAAHWETFGTQDGEVQLQLAFLPALSSESVEVPLLGEGVGAALPDPAALVMWRAGLFEWVWTASFETFVSELGDLGNRPGITPAGTYRFVVDGRHRGLQGLAPYHLESAPFQVVPWNGITVEDLRVEGDGRVSFAVGPVSEHRRFRDGMSAGAGIYEVPAAEPSYLVGPVDYPDSYAGGISWIANERQLNIDGPRDAGGHQQYCVRCSFRPWADTAEVATATATVRRGDGSTYTLPAVRQPDGRWATVAIRPGETAWVASGGIMDQYGEINGTASAVAVRP
ncbi:MAG TPA: Ig-like domain-containing protein [Nevskiales bacterium]|nr:Ig-like domain-containing protein [Nevskiales bacterium]